MERTTKHSGYCMGTYRGVYHELVRQEQGEPVLVQCEEATTEDLVIGLDRVELGTLAGEVRNA